MQTDSDGVGIGAVWLMIDGIRNVMAQRNMKDDNCKDRKFGSQDATNNFQECCSNIGNTLTYVICIMWLNTIRNDLLFSFPNNL